MFFTNLSEKRSDDTFLMGRDSHCERFLCAGFNGSLVCSCKIRVSSSELGTEHKSGNRIQNRKFSLQIFYGSVSFVLVE